MLPVFDIKVQREELDFYQPILCDCCHKYGRYEAYVEYSILRFIGIPCFPVKKRFYAVSTCCNNLYLIKNREKALMIERQQGHNVFLFEKDLELIVENYPCTDL
ncbi:MAG TPA: zinc-ribbon domain-containing protein [Tissierellia bacterium]|jgi:hypothetical protein|nr:zinc-ribbon domain-containing protein [Tissierellia bacterium]